MLYLIQKVKRYNHRMVVVADVYYAINVGNDVDYGKRRCTKINLDDIVHMDIQYKILIDVATSRKVAIDKFVNYIRNSLGIDLRADGTFRVNSYLAMLTDELNSPRKKANNLSAIASLLLRIHENLDTSLVQVDLQMYNPADTRYKRNNVPSTSISVALTTEGACQQAVISELFSDVKGYGYITDISLGNKVVLLGFNNIDYCCDSETYQCVDTLIQSSTQYNLAVNIIDGNKVVNNRRAVRP